MNQRMKELINRMLSMLLLIVMVVGLMPSTVVLADEDYADWGDAKWIWSEDDSTEADTWMNFRRDFELSSVPQSAELKVSVDTKYWLYVNGEEVIWEGQLVRGPNGTDTYYDTVDIADYLVSGENTIALEVWYWGNTNAHNQSSGSGGLLLSSDLVDANTGEDVESGDGEWKAVKNPANQQDSQDTGWLLAVKSVVYNARNEIDWVNPNYDAFDADGWVDAVVIGDNDGSAGDGPWNGLHERSIPQWRDYGRSELELTAIDGAASGQRYEGRLPYNAQFVPYIILGGSTQADKSIYMFSDTYNNGSQRVTYITKSGEQEYEGKNWINGDYVYFDVPDGVEIVEAGFRESGYAVSSGETTDFLGYFDSVITQDDASVAGFTGGHTWSASEVSTDNNMYDELWKKAVRTLYVTMRDTYLDCPDRERGQYVGDAVNEFEEAYYSLGPESYALTKKCLYEIFDTQQTAVINGRTYYQTSNVRPGVLPQEISTQVLTAAYSIKDYYLFTGDEEAVQHVWQNAYNYLTNWDMESNGEYAGTLAMRELSTYLGFPGMAGYIAEWSDWGNNQDLRPAFNLYWYIAAQSLLETASISGNATVDQRSWLKGRVNSIKKNFDVFWNEDTSTYGTEWVSDNARAWRSASAYEDGSHLVDDRINALAVVAGLVPEERYEAVRNVLIGTDSTPAYENASIYIEKYIIESLYRMGYPADAMQRIQKRHMATINVAADSSLPENFVDAIGDNGGATKNHGWSGGAMIAQSRYAAGIEPTDTGYSSWHVVPQMANYVEIETRVPSVIGNIDVSLVKNEDNTIEMTVISPGNDAEFWIPVEEGQNSIQLSGDAATYLGKEEKYNTKYAVYSTQSAGTYSFKSILAADKSDLIEAIEAVDFDEADYTAETWEVYENALADAMAINEKSDPTQEEIDAVLSALKNAIEGLTRKSMPFVDVKTGDWFYDYVEYVYDNSIMTGLTSAYFGPNDNLGRAQLATILYRLEGEPDVTYVKKFADVPAGKFYSDAVTWANQNGIVTGYDNGYFGTNDYVTRQDMSVMMYRYAKYKKYDVSKTAALTTFPDSAKVNGYASDAISWTLGTKIITGDGGNINPRGFASRAVAATIITRFMKEYN